jgi:cell division septation protein DedD
VATAALPAPASAAAPGGHFIQVAALSDEGRARALASVLGEYGPAFAAPTGSGMWRVRIGPLAQAQAFALVEDVRIAGYADARVVP